MALNFQQTRRDSSERYRTAPCDGGGAPRRPARSRWRAALRISATAAIASAAVLGATLAPAEAQFTGIFGFGDSYADTGAAPGGAFRISGETCSYAPNCTFTGSTTFVESLQVIYGLPSMTNYAIGGARTDNTNTFNDKSTPPPHNVPGFTTELTLSEGLHYASTDLIALSIGGNDLSAVDSTQGPSVIEGDAIASAQREVAGVQQMAAQGARNIVIFGTGSSIYFPEPPTDLNGLEFSDAQRNDWANTYYLTTEQLLAPLAQSGVRIFLFDFAVLQARLAADPGQYGFTSATNCEAGPPSLTTPNTVNSRFPGCFYENAVHPTGAGMALVANYMANQIDAPTTVMWNHESGLRGVWDVTFGIDMLTPSKYYSSDERFEVQGTKGFARVNRCTARVRQEPSVEVYVDGESRTYHALDDDWGSSFRDSSRQYIRWLRGDPAGELLWSAVEARAVMQFLTAARESSRRNTPVRIEEIGP